MAGSVNKTILIGNLGKDPEVRRTQAGDPVVSFSVATSERWKDKATGERKEKTEWHNVVVFNEHACAFAEKHLRKGMKVYVEGQNQTRKWEDREGNEHRTTEVVVTRFRGEVSSLDKPERAAPSPDDYGTQRSVEDHNAYRDAREGRAPANGSGRPTGSTYDDDIPFAPEVRG